MSTAAFGTGRIVKLVILLIMFFGLWFAPVPAGLTVEAWHLFAVFASAITSVVLNVFPLFTSAVLACAIVVLTGTLTPEKAYGAFANAIVLLVVTAFLVSQAVVKSGLGKRISLYVISLFGKSTLGLAYSIFITDTLIAPGFPSNTARGGVLFPVILALAQSRGSTPDDENLRRLGGYLMFCGMASLAITSALWFTATSGNPVGAALAAEHGMRIDFGSWLLASSVPCLVVIALLPAAALSCFSARNHRHSGSSRHRPQRTADNGADVAQRVDHGGDFRDHGHRLDTGGSLQAEPDGNCPGRSRHADDQRRFDA
jgi:DASS family divalent anion:Na+ symporter